MGESTVPSSFEEATTRAFQALGWLSEEDRRRALLKLAADLDVDLEALVGKTQRPAPRRGGPGNSGFSGFYESSSGG